MDEGTYQRQRKLIEGHRRVLVVEIRLQCLDPGKQSFTRRQYNKRRDHHQGDAKSSRTCNPSPTAEKKYASEYLAESIQDPSSWVGMKECQRCMQDCVRHSVVHSAACLLCRVKEYETADDRYCHDARSQNSVHPLVPTPRTIVQLVIKIASICSAALFN